MKIHNYTLIKKRKEHFWKQLSFSMHFTRFCGRLSICASLPLGFIKNDLHDYNTIDTFNINVHLLPRAPNNKLWGYEQDWYDGPLHTFGIGPFALICWDTYPALER